MAQGVGERPPKDDSIPLEPISVGGGRRIRDELPGVKERRETIRRVSDRLDDRAKLINKAAGEEDWETVASQLYLGIGEALGPDSPQRYRRLLQNIEDDHLNNPKFIEKESLVMGTFTRDNLEEDKAEILRQELDGIRQKGGKSDIEFSRKLFDNVMRAKRVTTWATDPNYSGFKRKVKGVLKDVATDEEIKLAEDVAKGKRNLTAHDILVAARAIDQSGGETIGGKGFSSAADVLRVVTSKPNIAFNLKNLMGNIKDFTDARTTKQLEGLTGTDMGNIKIDGVANRMLNAVWMGLTRGTSDEKYVPGQELVATAEETLDYCFKTRTQERQGIVEGLLRRHEIGHVARLIELRMIDASTMGEMIEVLKRIRPTGVKPGKPR